MARLIAAAEILKSLILAKEAARHRLLLALFTPKQSSRQRHREDPSKIECGPSSLAESARSGTTAKYSIFIINSVQRHPGVKGVA
jgi:hypothetical protein